MPNAKKVQIVEELTRRVGESQSMILADYRGLTVEDMEKLRAGVRAQSAQFQVVKNRLMKIALAENPALEQIVQHLEGPTGVAFGYDDPVALAKAMLQYSREFEALELKAGILGESALDAAGIENLARMPDLPQLRAQLAYSMKEPMRRVVFSLSAPAREMATAVENMRRKMLNAFQNYATSLEG